MRILNKKMRKNNQKCRCWKYIQKCRHPVKIRQMVKSLRPLKIRRMVKSLQPLKIRRMVKSLCLSKSLSLVKYQRPWKCWHSRKSRRHLKNSLLFRLGRISNCWLLPGPAGEHVLLLVDVLILEHVVSKWGVSSHHSAFRGRLSPVPYRLFVPAHHAQKWSKSMLKPKIRRPPGMPLISVKSQQSLSLLIGTLSKSHKNTSNHYCYQYQLSHSRLLN